MRNQIQRAFNDHKGNAKKRGIPFNFTFEEWVSWWEVNLGPDWFKLRGCKKYDFVMARLSDVGPYQSDNVECVTFWQNQKDQAKNGRSYFKKGIKHPVRVGARCYDYRPHQDGIKISPEVACEIYVALGTQRSLALKYGVSERLVRLIKNRQVWQTATVNL